MPTSRKLIYIQEPELVFGYGQKAEFTKDGLFLFGPLDSKQNPPPMRIGAVGSKKGISLYKKWIKSISGYIPPGKEGEEHHVAFPGFETIFGINWPLEPVCELEIPQNKITDSIQLQDRHRAIYETVSLFDEKIRKYTVEEDQKVDLWFVVIPEEVYKYGRPESRVPGSIATESSVSMNKKLAQKLEKMPSLFHEDHKNAEVYNYDKNFHNQLKARLLDTKEIVQIVRETTLSPKDFMVNDRLSRQLQDPATVAWNLCVASYFKSSGRPWKLASVRDGVSYVGLVFKQDLTNSDPRNACCGAQMFLDSGDGLVFKGAMGPWYSEETGQFHIPYEKAKELSEQMAKSYADKHGKPPSELFIHGKTRINEDEWRGFLDGVPDETKVVAVRLQDEKHFKLYGSARTPPPRGTAFIANARKGYLMTKGYVPRLQRYPGWEVPKPLLVEIAYGDADLKQVMEDILGLTKVNFNTCIYADGEPVTLRFADSVGEILTSTPTARDVPPLPFKHYM